MLNIKIVKESENIYNVFDENNKLVAFVRITEKTNKIGNISMYVDDKYQKHGLKIYLLKFVEEELLKENGYEALRLYNAREYGIHDYIAKELGYEKNEEETCYIKYNKLLSSEGPVKKLVLNKK